MIRTDVSNLKPSVIGNIPWKYDFPFFFAITLVLRFISSSSPFHLIKQNKNRQIEDRKERRTSNIYGLKIFLSVFLPVHFVRSFVRFLYMDEATAIYILYEGYIFYEPPILILSHTYILNEKYGYGYGYQTTYTHAERVKEPLSMSVHISFYISKNFAPKNWEEEKKTVSMSIRFVVSSIYMGIYYGGCKMSV